MNYFWSGPVNTNCGSGPVNTNWGPGPVNTNWGPGSLNTNWRPGPLNTNCESGPEVGSGARSQGQVPSKGPGARKHEDPKLSVIYRSSQQEMFY